MSVADDNLKPRTLRSKLTGEFVAALQADFEAHGQQALSRVREEAPGKYCELVARLCPTEAIITETTAIDDINLEELAEVLIEGMVHNPQMLRDYERMIRTAKRRLAEIAATEDPTNKRARIMWEGRKPLAKLSLPWARTN